MLEARKAVRSLKEYRPPLAGRQGLRLDFNENTVGCSPRVIAKLRQIEAWQLSCYPERDAVSPLVAAFLGLDASQVLVTNGVDDAIHLLCEAYLEPEDEALIVVPTFSMYQINAQATGARVITVQAEEDFRFPAEAVLARMSARTRLIAIANPNNPTGAAAPREALLAIARSAPQAAVLVDEAYFEFYGQSLMAEVGKAPNLFVARTFSKAYGLAGLRIGILAADATQLELVRRVSSPYNVNAVALACLPEALADQQYVRDYVVQVLRGRERIQQTLKSLGIQYWPSQANFVLAHFGNEHERVLQRMKDCGILLRDRNADPGCAGCVRITAGTDAQTDRLIEVLRATVAEFKAAKVSA